MKKTLIVIFIAIAFTSCKSVLKMTYGIKKPKQENKESLMEYLSSKKLNSQNVLLIKSKKNYNSIFERFGGMPEAILFDSEGYELSFKEKGENCNALLSSMISNLNTKTNFKKSDKEDLLEFIELFTDLEDKEVQKITKSDFYPFINWAKFTGKLNKIVKDWEQLAEDNNYVIIKVYKVNKEYKIKSYFDILPNNEKLIKLSYNGVCLK